MKKQMWLYAMIALAALALSGCAGMQSGGFKNNMSTEKPPEQLAKCQSSFGTVHLERVVKQYDDAGIQQMYISAPAFVGEKCVSSTGCFNVVPAKDTMPGQQDVQQPTTRYILRYTYDGGSKINNGPSMAAAIIVPFIGLTGSKNDVGQVTLSLYRAGEQSPILTSQAATEDSKFGTTLGLSGDVAAGQPGGKQYPVAFATALDKMVRQLPQVLTSLVSPTVSSAKPAGHHSKRHKKHTQ